MTRAAGSAASPMYDEAWFAARATAGVQRLEAYDPGHDLVALRARFGEHSLVELGSNENSHGPSPAAREAIVEQLYALHRYPDPRGGVLRQALAGKHGVGIDRIVLGNGSHELLMQFAQVFAGPGDEVVFSQYGFAVFALATQAAGATARVVPALSADDAMPLGHDLDAIAAAITPATKLVYLANPNNPTGTWFSRARFASFMDAVPAGVIVVMDEAYAEMADLDAQTDARPLLARHGNLVVTRTFSKGYGLAALRVGYALAAPGLVAVMERVRESFNVNGPALAACAAALGDEAHLAWACERNAEQRDALSATLRARGLRVLPSQTNFLLVEFGGRTAAIEAALLERGVVLRPMRGYGLLTYSRITVGTRDENRRVIDVLDGVLA